MRDLPKGLILIDDVGYSSLMGLPPPGRDCVILKYNGSISDVIWFFKARSAKHSHGSCAWLLRATETYKALGEH